ncbi:hypothetical protein DW757_16065 [Clostridium sp. AM29-11AC]|nr:hypothetical protein DW757_16065 [Clostridium sp. AM29-11AC]
MDSLFLFYTDYTIIYYTLSIFFILFFDFILIYFLYMFIYTFFSFKIKIVLTIFEKCSELSYTC